MNKISLNVKSQRDQKNWRFFQNVKQQADDSKNLRCETLYISNYECVNVSLLLCQILSYGRRCRLSTHQPLYSFRFIQSKAQN